MEDADVVAVQKEERVLTEHGAHKMILNREFWYDLKGAEGKFVYFGK